MLGLVIATAVMAMLESKAKKKALAQMQPQPMDGAMDPGLDPMAGGDDFGDASFDENEFK